MNRFTTNGGNSVQTLAQWQTATGHDLHSIVATPSQLFVNPAVFDFHLLGHEPGDRCRHVAVRAGRSISKACARPSGSGIDIGADERNGGTAAATTSPTAEPNRRRPTSRSAAPRSRRIVRRARSSARSSAVDPDAGDTHTFTLWSIAPAVGSRYRGNRIVRWTAAALLNFEAATSHTRRLCAPPMAAACRSTRRSS